MRLVLLGIMGHTPFAGVAWQVLHYLEGFRRLGCDVHYVEDTGAWPYDPEQNAITADPRHPLRYIGGVMEWAGLADRWAYVTADGEPLGPAASGLDRVLGEADLLINLTGATVLREAHLQVPVRIYLETDPVRPQIEVAQGRQFTIDLLASHTHHFSYGENLGYPGCGVPVVRFHYRPTRQPVILDWWASTHRSSATKNGRLTTVASWKQSGKEIAWRGETYHWSKHLEFAKFLDFPRRVRSPVELALACGEAEDRLVLERHGWLIIDALPLTRTHVGYRDYIRGSRAEFTVAKDQNVRLRSGWFSDRSACYLAAGKPVITQDTGFGRVLPTGAGLFSFDTLDDVVCAVEEIDRDYAAHAAAAHSIAAEYFAAERVLGRMLDEVGLR